MRPQARRSPRSTARRATRLSVALSPDGHLLAVGGFGTSRTRLGRPHPEARPRARPGRQRSVHPRVQPGRPDSRHLRIRARRRLSGTLRPEPRSARTLTAGDRRTMIDLSADGRQLLEVHGNGQGAVWDVDPESWKRRACDARQPHADARGVGGVPPRAAVRAGLRELSPTQGRIDQVKRVSVAGGARPPGRRPRRTSSVGGVASRASLRRAGPRPSRCHLVDSPTTSRPASRLASSMPSSPGGVSSGSAEMPRTRWTASAPCESRRLASRLPCSGTAAAPASRSGASVGAREPRAELDRRPVVLGPSERDEHGALEASRPEERAAPRRRASPRGRR